MSEDEFETIIVAEAEHGQRLDKVLTERFKEVGSRTYFQFLFEEQRIFVNGKPSKKRHLAQAGDEVEVHFICTPDMVLKPEAIPLDIIYEDESIILVNKPAGMVVHPAAGNWTGTFVNALLHHCTELNQFPLAENPKDQDRLRPGIVHRLDKETTGLLLAAKNATAHRRLVEQFANRRIYKEYRAICVGKPGDVTIDQPIARHPTMRKMMAVAPRNGKKAVTICQTLAYNGEISFLKIILPTGRTHQIRVHLKHCGTPVLGDTLYGSDRTNRTYGIDRQMLHAHTLRFEHPVTGEEMEFQASLPEEMLRVLRTGKLLKEPII